MMVIREQLWVPLLGAQLVKFHNTKIITIIDKTISKSYIQQFVFRYTSPGRSLFFIISLINNVSTYHHHPDRPTLLKMFSVFPCSGIASCQMPQHREPGVQFNWRIILHLIEIDFWNRYVEWGDLLEYINSRRPLTSGRARLWSYQTGLAIEYLHTLGFAHRDIKCENILITSHMNVKLCDFGFAKYVLKMSGNKASLQHRAESFRIILPGLRDHGCIDNLFCTFPNIAPAGSKKFLFFKPRFMALDFPQIIRISEYIQIKF